MIHIVKESPPIELIRYNKSFEQQKCYENFRDKNSIRKALLEEQGYICAYCMCAIGYDSTKWEKEVRIEHYRCQDEFENLQLDYNNMFAVCTCSERLPQKEQHCDVLKGNKYLHFDPKNIEHIKTLRYSEGGVLSTNQQFTEDIENTLGLNHSYLPLNRQKILTDQLVIARSYIKNKRISTKDVLSKMLSIFYQKDKYGRYKPYCGIVIEYCKRIEGR